MNKLLPVLATTLIFCGRVFSQSCTPQGNQTSYGTNHSWRGYVYHNPDFTSYAGYITVGNPVDASFDQNFGGDDVNFATNGCAVQTSTFSVRYKLNKNFAAGGYLFTVGGDDGFRLSLDGGATWVINRWFDQGYTTETYVTYLSGSYNLVLEYYENQGGNRISFSVASNCMGSEDPTEYGTNDQWRGYVYDGTNFNLFKGTVLKGSPGNISFDEEFGGSNVVYNTSSCATTTETFSVRYRLRKNFPSGNYVFTIGGDDGYRLSLDGGNTWVIDRWFDQSYNTATYSTSLSGYHDLVLEYYENGGDNRISLAVQSNVVLDIRLLAFNAKPVGQEISLNWAISKNSDPRDFVLERSTDGRLFSEIAQIDGSDGLQTANQLAYTFTDKNVFAKKYWYRLRMTDQQLKTTYSNVLLVNTDAKTQGNWQVFPSVVEDGSFTIRSNRNAENPQWALFDLNGRKLRAGQLGRQQAGQVTNIILGKTGLPAGMYVVGIYDNSEAPATFRLILR